jgi:predicted alpha/beta-hydrolase family hydrolase
MALNLYRAATGSARAALVLGHGAGAGQFHPFMVSVGKGLAALGIDVATFDFPYMQRKRKVPDSGPVLETAFRDVVDEAQREIASARQALFIGGKSMGGRIATQLAAARPDLPLAGLVLLGYPLHPPGNPAKRRDAHLPSLGRPALFVQGSRDTFGTPDELRSAIVAIKPPATLHVVEGGDHSLKVPRGSTQRQSEVDAHVQRTIAEWLTAVIARAKPTAR